MTELTRVVRRKVATVRGQPLVIALSPDGIWLREPRRRTAYLLPVRGGLLVRRALAGGCGPAREDRQTPRLEDGRMTTVPSTRRVTVSVSMPAASADCIQRAAMKKGQSLSRYIREAAEKAAE